MKAHVCLSGTTILLATILGCGGGGSNSSNNPPTPVVVNIFPMSASVAVGSTQQFTATVDNTTNKTVSWQVNGIAAGNSVVGTISSSGLYTAPATVPNPASVTVAAVSQADTSKSASASVTITSSTTALTIEPSAAVVPAGATQPFTVTNNIPVMWNVNGIVGGNAIWGTISSSGLYTAPLSPPAAGQVTVTAISQSDSTHSASASVTPVFSNASLSGPYAFKSATVSNGSFSFAGGVLVADGNGNLTNGIEDVNDLVAGATTDISFSGTYNVGADGRGTAVATSSFGTTTFKFVLISNTSGQMIEFDNIAVNSGFVLAQDTSAMSNISGTMVFGFQGIDTGSAGFVSSIGQVQFDGLGNTSGTEDVNDAGTFSGNIPFSGTYRVGSQGRGTATLTSVFGISNFVFYIVNAKTIEFLNIDSSGQLVSGNALAQDNVAFGNSSLTSSAFLVSGEDTLSFSTLVGAGRFDTDGAGTIQNGILDENDAGSFFDGVPFAGTYSTASTGRGTASITTASGTTSFVFCIYAGGNAQFMESDSFAAASGVARSQEGAPFGNSSFQGNFAFALGGASGASPFAGLGQVSLNGGGGISGTEDFNLGGSIDAGVLLNGTYLITTNGSGTASVNGSGTTPLRVQMINPGEAVFISADPSQPLIGLVEKQCSDCH
jgi:hypothetical protein